MNIALCIFNRPDLTARVFDAVRQAQPQKLFLIADGPRNAGDERKCEQTRVVVQKVDWPCEVHRNYSDTNLGCGRRLPTGLDWVFGHVEDAIVLEDDCLPHPDFFPFCAELLERFRGDERIAQISGTNVCGGVVPQEASYSFSIYPSNWGWATWRRAWKKFDQGIVNWTMVRSERLHWGFFPKREERQYFEEVWDALYEGRIVDVWDCQWVFACMAHHMLSVRPSVNLVSNIGFGKDVEATHTGFDHPVGNAGVRSLGFPLRHPELMVVDWLSDARLAEVFYRIPDPVWRLVRQTLLNRYWYGKQLRKAPLLGKAWARWRKRTS
jgi:hypothetical protein